jgi:hypothetical protein
MIAARGNHQEVESVFDGFVYACLTAAVFGWLWPR